MLAGEPFIGHPRSVCPVIGAFLRAYNDRRDDCWRQDLYEYATKVVGTRATIEVERQRAQMCRAWVRRMKGPGALSQEPLSCSEEPGGVADGCGATATVQSMPAITRRSHSAASSAAAVARSTTRLIAVRGREELDRPTERGATPDVESLSEAL